MPNAIYSLFEAIGYTHPVHPLLVHISVGTVIGTFLFGIVALVLKRPVLWTTARHGVVLSFICSFFTIFMGIMDSIRAEWWGSTTIKIKLVLSGVLVLLLLATILVNRRLPKESPISLIFYTLALANVLALGFLGAGMVDYTWPIP